MERVAFTASARALVGNGTAAVRERTTGRRLLAHRPPAGRLDERTISGELRFSGGFREGEERLARVLRVACARPGKSARARQPVNVRRNATCAAGVCAGDGAVVPPTMPKVSTKSRYREPDAERVERDLCSGRSFGIKARARGDSALVRCELVSRPADVFELSVEKLLTLPLGSPCADVRRKSENLPRSD